MQSTRTKPKLKSNVIIKKIDQGGRISYVLSNRDADNVVYFGLNEVCNYILTLMNGENTLSDIERDVAKKFNVTNTNEEISKVLEILIKESLLEQEHSNEVIPEDKTLPKINIPVYKKILQISYSFKADKFLSKLHKHLRFLFTGPAIIIMLSVFITGIIILIYLYDEILSFFIGLKHSITPINLLLFLLAFYVIQIVVLVIHEIAHGLTCKHYGGEYIKMGIMMYYFRFVFFCDTSEAWLFRKKSQRILVSLAGPLATWLIGSLGAYLWVFSQNPIIRIVCLFLISLAFGSNIYFDLNPLLKYDGYYILSDLLEIPNLRGKSFNYLKYLLLAKLFKKDIRQHNLNKKERVTFVLYGVLSFIYSAFMIGSVVYFVFILFSKFSTTGNWKYLLPLVLFVLIIFAMVKSLVKRIKSKVQQ